MICSEAEVLNDCFLSYEDLPEAHPQENPTNQLFIEERVNDCIQKSSHGSNALLNLKAWGILEANEVDWCPSCASPADLCDSSRHSRHTRTEYRIQWENLLTKWKEWLVDNTDLNIERSVRNSDLVETLFVDLYGDQLRLNCFFSAEDLRQYNFNSSRLEFGIGFFDHRFLPSEDPVFSWVDPLESSDDPNQDFDVRLHEMVTKSKDAISASFVDTKSLDESARRNIRDEIWMFLQDEGFSPSRSINDKISCHKKYNIEPIGDDFVATATIGSKDTAVLLCRCDKVEGSYHFHQFEDQTINSVGLNINMDNMLSSIDKNINDYLDIGRRKNQAHSLTKLSAGVSALLSTLLFTDGLVNWPGIFENILPDGVSMPNEILLTLAIVNVVILFFIAIVLLKPYWDSLRFEWEIDRVD